MKLWLFVLNSVSLGIGLAMDAFSVSMANGLAEPSMKADRQLGIAGCFAFFQFLMPMVGWVCVHTIVTVFTGFQRFVPWIALGLLGFIGIKMILEGIETRRTGATSEAVSNGGLVLQGIATSIDALSVGFAIAGYDLTAALICALIVGAVTWIICLAGVSLGKKLGMVLAGHANILGGLILIGIGIEILIS